jgi:hypothetical protein
MGYKEKIQVEIKKEKLKNLWQKICEAYEEGGVDQIKLELDSLITELKENYKQVLKKIEKML